MYVLHNQLINKNMTSMQQYLSLCGLWNRVMVNVMTQIGHIMVRCMNIKCDNTVAQRGCSTNSPESVCRILARSLGVNVTYGSIAVR